MVICLALPSQARLRAPAILKTGHFFSQCTEGALSRRMFRNPDLCRINVTRWSFEYEPQSLLDQVLELATPQCRFRLSPAVEIVRDFDRGLHRVSISA
jgi:hypothetical protein